MASSSGIARRAEYYRTMPWSYIADNNRIRIVRDRLVKPATCWVCGGGPVFLFNLSGYYRDDDADYEWMCRPCHYEMENPRGTYVQPGDKLKPWSELSRKGKVHRIRRDLPKPDRCLYCDSIQVELASRSGAWLEDLADYAWVCRHHRYMIEAVRPDPVYILIEPDRDMFPWFYNDYYAAGTIQAPSILETNCAMGRFCNK